MNQLKNPPKKCKIIKYVKISFGGQKNETVKMRKDRKEHV
jgi:hypothetical protein